jgi:predicted MPP superfamily phosphohydrolase
MEYRVKVLDHIKKRDFTNQNSFPGEFGNQFDVILRNLNKLESIHYPLIIFLLALISGIATLFQPSRWLILVFASFCDVIFISLQPKQKIAFGPLKIQVLLLFFLRIPFMWLPQPWYWIAQITGGILVIWGFLVEPSKISKTVMRLNSTKLTQNESIHFVQLGDIHLERIGIRETMLINNIKSIAPQFIVYTGDFLNLSNNEDPVAIEQVIELFNQIAKIAPIYYVNGSVAVDLAETLKKIDIGINAVQLKNQSVLIEGSNYNLELLGLHCTHRPHQDIALLPKTFENFENFRILAYHSPDIIFELPADNSIDLVLSGHTHGGQVRLPIFGAIFTGSLYGRLLQCGLYRYYSTHLYISRGIGLEGQGAPRVRFLCPPEIVEWYINPKGETT